jgi:hypothetical protein
MKQKELKLILDAGLVSSVRVVPIPLSNGWCVDVLIKELLISGSRTATLESDRSSTRRPQVRRFATIDSAARFLHRLGIPSFHVDMADSISFATTDPVRSTMAAETVSPDLDDAASQSPGRV